MYTQSQSKVSVAHASEDLRQSSQCLGADMLMKLLGNYCRNKDIKTSITVGIVGKCYLCILVWYDAYKDTKVCHRDGNKVMSVAICGSYTYMYDIQMCVFRFPQYR